jgi:hypothetical protein
VSSSVTCTHLRGSDQLYVHTSPSPLCAVPAHASEPLAHFKVVCRGSHARVRVVRAPSAIAVLRRLRAVICKLHSPSVHLYSCGSSTSPIADMCSRTGHLRQLGALGMSCNIKRGKRISRTGAGFTPQALRFKPIEEWAPICKVYRSGLSAESLSSRRRTTLSRQTRQQPSL